ncbi:MULTISPECIES: hypothetical protein, partial [unclassified Aeromonas]
KQESRKAGKQESRKAGKQESRKAGKQESRKAGKQESRKAWHTIVRLPALEPASVEAKAKCEKAALLSGLF